MHSCGSTAIKCWSPTWPNLAQLGLWANLASFSLHRGSSPEPRAVGSLPGGVQLLPNVLRGAPPSPVVWGAPPFPSLPLHLPDHVDRGRGRRGLDLGSGRIVALEKESPNVLANPACSGWAVVQRDNATEPYLDHGGVVGVDVAHAVPEQKDDDGAARHDRGCDDERALRNPNLGVSAERAHTFAARLD